MKAIGLFITIGWWLHLGCSAPDASKSAPIVQDTIIINDDDMHALLVSDALLLADQATWSRKKVELRQNMHYPSKKDTSMCFNEQLDSLCVTISFGRQFITALRLTSGTNRTDDLRVKDRLPNLMQHRINTCSYCILELSTSEGFNPFSILFCHGIVESISYRQTYLD